MSELGKQNRSAASGNREAPRPGSEKYVGVAAADADDPSAVGCVGDTTLDPALDGTGEAVRTMAGARGSGWMARFLGRGKGLLNHVITPPRHIWAGPLGKGVSSCPLGALSVACTGSVVALGPRLRRKRAQPLRSLSDSLIVTVRYLLRSSLWTSMRIAECLDGSSGKPCACRLIARSSSSLRGVWAGKRRMEAI